MPTLFYISQSIFYPCQYSIPTAWAFVFHSKLWHGALSNAFWESKYHTSSWFSLSLFLKVIYSMYCNKLLKHDFPFRELCWLYLRTLNFSEFLTIMFSIIAVNLFLRTDIKLVGQSVIFTTCCKNMSCWVFFVVVG